MRKYNLFLTSFVRFYYILFTQEVICHIITWMEDEDGKQKKITTNKISFFVGLLSKSFDFF